MNVDAASASLRSFLTSHPESEIAEQLRYLQNNGFGKIESIAALKDVAGMETAEAKRQVHFSTAWAQRREQDEALHDELERFIEEAP
ncbi:hypothetical protein [Deinococcus multiflagellatus]|uniref:Nif11 domain-containing protein n=1 Tax=Deinococcus multiflagellatus TaxID=1656887 RepID=A0ABW1ZL51_9DEIO|nr:hypothetical protein [Deinococcus multiflagellatus]MBZ9712309.1 hypothetical protein [Deinococcus multiflagellatus]